MMRRLPSILAAALLAAALAHDLPAQISSPAIQPRAALAPGETVILPPVTTADGRTLEINQLRGRVVVLFFARRPQAASAAEAQMLSRAARHWQGAGLEVIAVHLDASKKPAGPFRSVSLPGGAAAWAARLDAAETPSAAVIDRGGRLVATHLRGPALLEALEQQLGSPAPPTPEALFDAALEGDLASHEELRQMARFEPDLLVPMLTDRLIMLPPSPAAADLGRLVLADLRHSRPDRIVHYLAAHAAWYAGHTEEAVVMQTLALEEMERELARTRPGMHPATHPGYVDIACRLALFEAASGRDRQARTRLDVLEGNAGPQVSLVNNFWYQRAAELAAPRAIEASGLFR